MENKFQHSGEANLDLSLLLESGEPTYHIEQSSNKIVTLATYPNGAMLELTQIADNVSVRTNCKIVQTSEGNFLVDPSILSDNLI